MVKSDLWTKEHWPRVGASKPLKERANKKAFEEVRDELEEERTKLVDEKKWEELLICCDKMLSIRPKSWQSWWYKASASFLLSRYTEAIAYYDKAIGFDTEYKKMIKTHRNECYFWLVKKVAEYGPTHTDQNISLEKANDYLDKILEITESDDLQSIYQEKQKTFCGLAAYRSRPDNVWFEKGIVLYHTKGKSSMTGVTIPEEAAKCFAEAGKFGNKESFELTVKGFETEMVGDEDHNAFTVKLNWARSQGRPRHFPTVANYIKAIEYYREALELNPLNLIASDRISWVEAKQNINK